MAAEFDNEFEPQVEALGLHDKTNDEIEAELKAIELEEKRLDLEIKRETVAKIRAKRESELAEARNKILATKQFLATRKAIQDNCNHRKGGIGVEAVMRGQGTSAMYSVIKHKLPSNRYFVLCQRCGKEWHPADPLLGIKATPGYSEAINYPTDNSSSGSSVFFFEKTQPVQE